MKKNKGKWEEMDISWEIEKEWMSLNESIKRISLKGKKGRMNQRGDKYAKKWN